MRQFPAEKLAGEAIDLFNKIGKLHSAHMDSRLGPLSTYEANLVSYVCARVFLQTFEAAALSMLADNQAEETVELVIRLMTEAHQAEHTAVGVA